MITSEAVKAHKHKPMEECPDAAQVSCYHSDCSSETLSLPLFPVMPKEQFSIESTSFRHCFDKFQ